MISAGRRHIHNVFNKYVGPPCSRIKIYAARMPRAAAAAVDRYLLPAPDLSSKPAGPLLRSIDGTDRRTDRRTLDCFMTLTAYYAYRVSWRSGVVVSGVRRVHEVNARRARLVAGWVTVFGRVYHLDMQQAN